MYKQRHFRLLLSLCVLALVVFLPHDATASPFGNTLNLHITLHQNSEENPIEVLEETYDLDSLEGDCVIVDFNKQPFHAYGISGKIVYHKASNTVEFQSLNNEKSNAEMQLVMGVGMTKNFTCRFTGNNTIYGCLNFVSAPNDDDAMAVATLTGDGLRIKNHGFENALYVQGPNLQIINTSLQIQHEKTALSYYGAYRPTGLKIIHSAIDIQGASSSDEPQYGIIGGPLEFSGSTLSIKEKGQQAIGLNTGDKVVFIDSKATIETEGRSESVALYADSRSTDVAAEINNSEVYLTAKGPDDANEGKNFKAYGIGGNAYYQSGQPKNYVHLSNSILEAQGDTGAVQGILEFSESLHDAYVKKDLQEDKQFYAVNSKQDKKNLGFLWREKPTYKFVRIEPHLKTFVIDADALPVDQNIYEFVGWEAKGFMLDEPNSKKTKVKIPIVWDNDASIRAVWKKNDGGYRTVPVFSTVYKTPLIASPYLLGYPDKTIRPEGLMTRAEAVATVVRLERIKENDGRSIQERDKLIFSDVKDGDWYKKYIDYAYAQGWLDAKVGEAFYPNRPITRAELAQLISHVDAKNSATAPFKDVKGHKYETAINQAYGNGRIIGYEDNSFRPEGQIKRSEVASMLNRLYSRRPDKAFIDKHSGIITAYKDLDRNHWAYYDLVDAFEAHEYVKNEAGDDSWIRLIDATVK